MLIIDIKSRKENESYLEYFKRVIQLVRDDKIDYSEMGDCLLGVNNVYSSESLRKFFYVGSKIADRLEGDVVVTDTALISEIERQKEELYQERIKVRDKLRELNKKRSEDSRFENLRELLVDILSERPAITLKKEVIYSPDDIEAVLIISDSHIGIKIDNQLNYYDMDVAKERIEQLVNKTIHYCKLHKVKRLNVEILGDIVSGIINVSNRVEQEEDIITQIIYAGDLLTEVIKTLDENIPEVCVYTVFGNHSRITPDKKASVNRENLERLIYHHIKTCLPEIKIVTSMNDDFLIYSVSGRDILLVHGDKDTPGAAVTNAARLFNRTFDEIHMGHYHSFELRDDNDTDIAVNGSIVGTDDYAQSIRRATKPSQILRIYDNDICTYKLTLQ